MGFCHAWQSDKKNLSKMHRIIYSVNKSLKQKIKIFKNCTLKVIFIECQVANNLLCEKVYMGGCLGLLPICHKKQPTPNTIPSTPGFYINKNLITLMDYLFHTWLFHLTFLSIRRQDNEETPPPPQRLDQAGRVDIIVLKCRSALFFRFFLLSFSRIFFTPPSPPQTTGCSISDTEWH